MLKVQWEVCKEYKECEECEECNAKYVRDDNMLRISEVRKRGKRWWHMSVGELGGCWGHFCQDTVSAFTQTSAVLMYELSSIVKLVTSNIRLSLAVKVPKSSIITLEA